jgi:transcriptional regulator with XRE-family HTH domain
MALTRLKQLREEAVLTVHELAEASGVSDDTISKIENGQRVARPNTLRKLARALNVSPQELRRPVKVEEPVPLAKAPYPGPSLLDKALDAGRRDEEKKWRTINRLKASEGVNESIGISDYEEDKFRAELRAGGVPDEYFESLIWPLVTTVIQHEQEITRLREEAEQESMHR